MKMRNLSIAALVICLLAPSNVSAAPNPSPALGNVLAAPVVEGFVEATPEQTPVEGPITLAELASAGDNPNQDAQTLKQDGFVASYGRTWVDNAKSHALQELVIAFSGGAGAAKWLGSSKRTDTGNQYYLHAVPVQGIGSYYGVHLADPMRSEYVDLIGLVKGNDYFLIAALSMADDLDSATASQAKGQYDFAPSSTIPPSQWPEHPVGPFTRLGDLARLYAPEAAGVAVLLLVLAIAAFVLIRRRRRGTHGIAETPISPDGTYWWDGDAWRDSSKEAPPNALRSEDGYYWWDGRMWRLMPEPPELEPGV
jgi:hypothetical protein